MDDSISRKMAIDKMQIFIDSLDKEATAYKSLRVAFNRCIIELKRLPSAQTERKKGKWITYRYLRENWSECECDQCHKYVKVAYDFCPNCGADMRGERDGNN